MLAIIKNKWDIKYIQILPVQQQRLLWEILAKIFITKKLTQSKTSCTLKIDGFETPDNKNIGKLFSKYELLFLDQANSTFDSS